MNPAVGLLLAFVLLCLNGVFVAAEFSLILARRTQLEPAAQAGSRPAKMALHGIENLALSIAACQLGVTVCSLLLGAVAEPTAESLLEPAFHAVGLSRGWVDALAIAIALAVVTFAHALFGEMVPKNLALVRPERSVLLLAPILLTVAAILRPIVVGLNATAHAAVRLLGIEPKHEVTSTFTAEEVAGLLEESRREGLLDEHEFGLVSGALEFSGGTVAQVLLPLGELVTVSAQTTLAQVERACADTGFSRFPVLDETGDLTGYLHVKDVLDTQLDSRDRPLSDHWLQRPLATIAPDTGLYQALRAMQKRGAHMARVADETGQPLGVVMLEDVLAELVGEIRP
jgi:CBS domain containing-hemolysin-like protein